MPSIETLLGAPHGLGWNKGAGPNFYFPGPHPHVHIGVANSATIVADLRAIRAHITFISLSYGGHPATVNLYQRNLPNEQFEIGAYNLDKKAAFENALYGNIGVGQCVQIQRDLNIMTGIGIDI